MNFQRTARKISKICFSLLLFSLLFNTNIYGQLYLDSAQSVDNRVEDLLSRMTLDEKVGQMTQADRTALGTITDIKTYNLGSLLSGGGSAPANNSGTGWADMYDSYQKEAIGSRLKIPLIYGIDAVHGHNNVKDAVIFPHNIGLGCTRNPELIKRAAQITALEIMGTGLNWTFAPCIAVPRNERWGRTYEGFGELPELVTQMGAAAVKGFQGDSLMGKASILACAKHYMGDGGTTGGIDQGNTEVDESTLRKIHLPAYIEAIKAGAGSVMASYSSWNGQKMHGDKYLLTDVLKTELGFKGFVVSDWAAINQLPGVYLAQVETSINAGIDMVMLPANYKEFIAAVKTLVGQGKITQTRIDDAVRRILRIKFQMGLFEKPFADRTYSSLIGSDSHRLVARECVRQSLVLLKKKDNILPLTKDNMKIHVAGKNAQDIGNQCGGWTISWQGSSGNITKGTTILDGIKSAVKTSTVTYSADGSGVNGSDIGIAVIGETPYAEGLGDRTDLALSPEDIAAVRNLKSAGIPVIVILISGRPMILNPILHYSDAIIAAWLPGTEGGGIADILFGDYQPSGLLSHSWPKDMAQIPINFGDALYSPLFPYGYGITTLKNSDAGSAPVFTSAAVSNDGLKIEMSFNKKMADPSASFGGFTFMINSSLVTVSKAELKSSDNSTLLLTLAQPVKKNDVITVNYTPGTIQAQDGGKLDSFANLAVYNILNEFAGISIPGKIQAENYSNMSGIQTENTTDTGGGLNVGWIEAGDWMDYLLNISSTGTYKVDFRIASSADQGQIILKLSDTIIATLNLPVTGGWQNWQTVSTNCTLTEGNKMLRVLAGHGGFNLNWFEISSLVSVEKQEGIPVHYTLTQNYPNPFNPATKISYSIPEAGNVQLIVYDMLGHEVATLVNETQSAGTYLINFDSIGYSLSSGIYFYTLQAGGFRSTRKLILLK
ncbi:MAG: glycoside hydrolase family 3 N-terminal domain-containing protein [Methanococcaceae archaeon]